MPCFFITSLHNKIHSQALKLADSGMSDYEENDEDVVDVVENETIDWGEDHEVDQEKSLYRGKQSIICFINIYRKPRTSCKATTNSRRILSIYRSSYFLRITMCFTVSRRPKCDVPVSSVSLDKNASRSFNDDCIATSFTGPNITSNSTEFCGNG